MISWTSCQLSFLFWSYCFLKSLRLVEDQAMHYGQRHLSVHVGDSSRRCEEIVKKTRIAPLNAIIIISLSRVCTSWRLEQIWTLFTSLFKLTGHGPSRAQCVWPNTSVQSPDFSFCANHILFYFCIHLFISFSLSLSLLLSFETVFFLFFFLAEFFSFAQTKILSAVCFKPWFLCVTVFCPALSVRYLFHTLDDEWLIASVRTRSFISTESDTTYIIQKHSFCCFGQHGKSSGTNSLRLQQIAQISLSLSLSLSLSFVQFEPASAVHRLGLLCTLSWISFSGSPLHLCVGGPARSSGPVWTKESNAPCLRTLLVGLKKQQTAFKKRT